LVKVNTERRGTGLAVALAVIELATLVLVGLSWWATYWSWDPQHYGDPPGSYLRKALVVAITALVAAVVAAIRRVRAVAIGQVAMFVVICGILLCLKPLGERAYEDSYRDACYAGLGCDDPHRPPR
jgi:ABC-type transport system involved in cytochrome c biogenesis permease subunit